MRPAVLGREGTPMGRPSPPGGIIGLPEVGRPGITGGPPETLADIGLGGIETPNIGSPIPDLEPVLGRGGVARGPAPSPTGSAGRTRGGGNPPGRLPMVDFCETFPTTAASSPPETVKTAVPIGGATGAVETFVLVIGLAAFAVGAGAIVLSAATSSAACGASAGAARFELSVSSSGGAISSDLRRRDSRLHSLRCAFQLARWHCTEQYPLFLHCEQIIDADFPQMQINPPSSSS